MDSVEDSKLFEFLERSVNEASIPRGRAIALVDLGDAYYAAGDFVQALAAISAALDLFRSSDDTDEVANCLRKSGCILAELKRWDEALATIEEARETYLQLGDDIHVAKAESLLGSLLREIWRPEDSMEAFRSARRRFLAAGMEDEAALCNLRMAELHSEMGAPESAIVELQIAEAGFSQAEIPDCEAEAVYLQGQELFQLDRFDEAARAFNKAQRIFRSCGLRFNAALCDQQGAQAKAVQGDLAGAIQTMTRARKGFEKTGVERMAAQCRRSIEEFRIQGG